MILLITGMPGSGKTEAAFYLMEKGFDTVEMGSVITSLMKEQHLEITPISVPVFATELRKLEGKEAVAKAIVKRIKDKKGDIVIVGTRSPAEINYFKANLSHVYVVAIIAPHDERFIRLKARGRKDDPKQITEFDLRENAETGYGILSAIEMADYKVQNTGTLETLREHIDRVISDVRVLEGRGTAT